MRQEIAGPADDVGVTGLAVGQTGYHVLADVDETHLGQQDPHDLTGQVLDGYRNGHVGLGVPDEVGRTEMRLAAPSLLKGDRR